MDQSWTTTLHAAAARIFEGLCFMMEGVEVPAPPSPLQSASVAFHGPVQGTLVVSVSEAVLPDVIGNMLGDENLSDEVLRDGLGELANVICGNVLPEIAGTDAVFALDAPLYRGEKLDESVGKLAAASDFAFEGGDARVELYIGA